MEDLWDDWRRRLTIVVQPVQSLVAAEAENRKFWSPNGRDKSEYHQFP